MLPAVDLFGWNSNFRGAYAEIGARIASPRRDLAIRAVGGEGSREARSDAFLSGDPVKGSEHPTSSISGKKGPMKMRDDKSKTNNLRSMQRKPRRASVCLPGAI